MTRYYTGNPVGSADPRDLYDNAENLDNAINGNSYTWTDRLGKTRTSIAGAINELDSTIERVQHDAEAVIAGIGYLPPVDFSQGILIDSTRITVDFEGVTYAPISSEVPFTTTSDFVPSQWRVIQGIVASDLSSSIGASLVGYSQVVGRTVDDRLKEYSSLLDYFDSSGKQENHTEMMVAALSASDTVFVPAGEYSITPSAVRLRSNNSLICHDSAVFTIQASSGQGDSNAALLVEGASGGVIENIRVEGGRWVSDNDRAVVVAVRSYSSNVIVSRINCSNIRALHTNDTAAGSYAASTFASRPKNVIAANCIGICTNQVTNNSFAQFNYCDGGGCFFNVIDGYWFGESWWGGDSNHNVNGAEGNERKTTALRFVGSVMGRKIPIRQAGVWGSMGEGILVSSVVVIGDPSISDVGIDFEGCIASSAVNCYAKNFRNGNFATFFLCNGVSFQSCTSVISDSNVTVSARINNSSQLASNRNIEFSGCTFINTVSTSRVLDAGAHNSTKYVNNKHLNVGTRFHSNNNGNALIEGNSYHFTISPSDPSFSALHLGRFTQGGVIANNNTFSSSIVWTAGLSALSLESSDTNPMVAQVSGGGTLGNQFPADIVVTNTGSNSSATLNYTIKDFNLFSGRYTVNNSGALAPIGYLTGCKSGLSRNPWPSAVPTSGYWSRGQTIDLSRSASIGSYKEAICIAAGTPGTWARSGLISS